MSNQTPILEHDTPEIQAALRTIGDALVGQTRERACAIMCSVCAMAGFYGEAQRFAAMAAQHKAALIQMEANTE